MSDISNSFALARQEQPRHWWPVMRDVGSVAAILIGIYFFSQAIYEVFFFYSQYLSFFSIFVLNIDNTCIEKLPKESSCSNS